MFEKDIKFTQKKVDESWKSGAKAVEIGAPLPSSSSNKSQTKKEKAEPSSEAQTAKPFINLISSLGYQAMLHLGEIPHPQTQELEQNLEAAREMIDLLILLQDKTSGNLSSEEQQMLQNLVAELQLKYSQKV